MNSKLITKISIFCFLFVLCGNTSSSRLPDNFNNCLVSLNDAVSQLDDIKITNELNFEYRIVREVTTREECIDMVIGTNLEQGAELVNGVLVDLVVGIKQNEVTETVKETEYELYLKQLEEKNLKNINLIESPLFGDANIEIKQSGLGVITYIRIDNPLNFDLMFSTAEGYIYGIVDNQVKQVISISNKTIRERESGLHSFEFFSNNSKDYLLVTYSGIDNKYYFTSYLLQDGLVNENEEIILASFDINDNNVHFGGKILKNNQKLYLCLGDQNIPGNSAKFDNPWGKIFSIDTTDFFEDPVISIDDERVSVLAYGLRNPWSCFFQNQNMIVPDVGNSHWEELNVLENYQTISEPLFFGWPWLESYFDANYKNLPVSEDIKSEQVNSTVYPRYLYPHGNDYCAIIGGTYLENSTKWDDYIFIGAFCTGTTWAVDLINQSKLIVLDKGIIPFSITTINNFGNDSLIVGTTSGDLIEVVLP